MFAGHGDPISVGQKSKLFKLRERCENHSRCAQEVRVNAKRYGPSGDRAVKYTYDEKYHYFGPVDSDIIPNATTIVFFHANGVPACEHAFLPDVLLSKFHNVNVCLFEYPGYGRRGSENASIYELDSVRNEIAAAWAVIFTKFKSTSMIAAGLSLGGGFSWSSVDRLDPPPKRLVLMNTFSDLGAFLREESRIYYPILSILAPNPIAGYRITKTTQYKWKGEVFVVHAIGDEFFPPEHEKIFEQHFIDMQCKYTRITLPANSNPNTNSLWHNDSLFAHTDKWINCFKLDS
jgi:hypothetical protein